MASEADKEGGGVANQDDGVSIDLPAPEGWRKIFTPRRGGTPRRNDVVYVSPTGEEIRSKRQLEQYLKSHPGNHSASDFDWGTGDTPRRSARISQKSKATETPEGASSQKRQKKSSTKKGAREKRDDIDGEGEAVEKAAAPASEEAKASEEVEMKEAEDVGDKSKEEVADKEALPAEDTEKDSEQKVEGKVDEMIIEKLENQSDSKVEQSGNNSSLAPGMEENKEKSEKQPAEIEAPALLPVPQEAESSEKEAVVKEACPEVADGKIEKKSKAEMGQEDHPDKGASTENVAESKEGQDVAKPMENHSARCEEAQHELKASQVSC